MKRILCWTALSLGAGLLLVGTPERAEAHICLDFPVSRVGEGCTADSPQLVGPCGLNRRSSNVNVFRPGEVIDIVFRETVDHPSHYRISFNPDGGAFPDPVSVDDINHEPHVMLDGIEDTDEATHTISLELPTLDCERCTLQLIQVIHDQLDNGFGGHRGGPGDNDDIHYACADIALRGEPVLNTQTDEPKDVPGGGRLAIVAVAACLGLVLQRPRIR